MIPLSRLPKLVELELWGLETIKGKFLKHFTTLKEVSCAYIKDIEEGLIGLIIWCSKLENISLDFYPDEYIISFILCAARMMRVRKNDIPLKICSNQCKVRLVPYKTEEDSSLKIFFEVYDSSMINRLPDFFTDDAKTFLNRMLMAMSRK